MTRHSYSTGGQCRTIVCGCGFTIKGDPNRIQLQFKLHTRLCKHNSGEINLDEPFNKTQGLENWRTKYNKHRVITGSTILEIDNLTSTSGSDNVVPCRIISNTNQTKKSNT